MEETFLYKCPSCGGKVNYDNINHKWICEYCGNSYETLFAIKENNVLPKMFDKKVLFYKHRCSNCNEDFVTTSKSNAICPKCNQECNDKSKEFAVTNMIGVTSSLAKAKMEYNESIHKVINFLPSEYQNDELKAQYINCDLYNGVIKLTYKNISKKYVFINVLIPNLDYEDYRFMYEIGNVGISNSKAFSSLNNNLVNCVNEFYKDFNTIEDKDYSEEIIKACIKTFKEEYDIGNVDEIIVDNNLKVEDGTFIPVYVKKIKINDGEYRQYIWGNHYLCSGNLLEFPNEPDSRSKTKKYEALKNIFKSLAIITAIILAFNIFFPIGYMQNTLPNVYFIVAMPVLIIVFTILWYIMNKKYYYYYNTIKLTKEEYFNQIINNSNFVKVISVKK